MAMERDSDALTSSKDADLIVQTCCTRALQGVTMVPSGADNLHQDFTGKELLLDSPGVLPLVNATLAACSFLCCFSQPEESAAFCSDAIELGLSNALQLHEGRMQGCVSDCKGSPQWNRNTANGSQQKLKSMKVSEACMTYCVYIPMKSFQLPKSNMVLCEAALEHAANIETRIDAEGFFERYNSHVSQGVYYLGGIFFREVTTKWAEEISLLDLMMGALLEILGCEEDTDFLSNTTRFPESSLLRNWTSERVRPPGVIHSIETVTVIGPSNAKGETEFRDELYNNPLCWSVVDKEVDRKEDLVGVWELLDKFAQPHAGNAVSLKWAARCLCKCWRDRVMAQGLCLPLQSAYLYYELVHQSSFFIANLSSDSIIREKLQSNTPLPSSHHNQEVAMLVALTQHLQSLAIEAEHFGIDGADMATETARWISFSFDSSQMCGGKTLQFQRAMDVLNNYGFDVHRHKCQLYLYELRSMILELKEACNPKEVVLVEPFKALHESIIPSYSCTSDVLAFKYIGDMVVDRSFQQNPSACESGCSAYVHPYSALTAEASLNAAARHLIDCLRHHVDPLKHLFQAPSHSSAATIDKWDCAFEDEAVEDVKAAVQSHEASEQNPATLFELLIQIMHNSDLPLQIAVTKLLLSQRAATPLVFPDIKDVELVYNGSEVPLTHCVQALCFGEVSLAKEQKVCIASDTSLPRIVFLSNKTVQDSHSAIVASRVLHCNFFSQHGRREMGYLLTPVIEVGIGFVSPRDSEPLACLSLHVTGSYQQLMGFVETIADLIVLELEQGLVTEHHLPTKSIKTLCWQETDTQEHCNRKNMMIWGQESYVVGEIRSFLSNACQRGMQKCRKDLREVCTAHFLPHQLLSFGELQNMVGQCDFAMIRKSLKLQISFLKEAQAHFDILQLNDNPCEKRIREQRCQWERGVRSELAIEDKNHPMLQLFYKILSQPDAISRRLGVMWLEKTISEMMYPLLEEATLRIDTSFKSWQRNPNNHQAKENYIVAKQDYVDKNLGIDNLWRESCHLYEADPLNQRHLAKQAAQYLLDGFPLEVLDGDAGMFCRTWVESVLVELDIMTRRESDGKAARIFVLSVMGLQSSGKSTILNLMFGTQLQTSAGRCTRGVFMQLVPSERAAYDYVVILDTEGIRSPEHFGLRSLEAHDNRIATFGLLPADASIFMVSNEDDSGLKEVLPTVLLAFKGSAMAESCGGRIKAKMVFVYRSVDTNDKKKLKGNREKLQEYLREAAEQVANIGVSSTREVKQKGCSSSSSKHQSASDLLQAVFTEFCVDENEGESDVKCMGGLKKACVPPDDTPDWAYGEQVIELREYVHKRVLEGGWTSLGLMEWAEHLTRVWDCVCSADFELSFRSAVEYSSYRDLQARLRPLRSELCQKYLDEFEFLEQKVRSMSEDESSVTLFSILDKNMEDLVNSKSKEVESVLAMKNWAKWRAGELDNWKHFCNTTKEWYKRRIEDMESGVVKFEKVVTNYERQIKEMILQMMDKGEWSMMNKKSERVRKQKFDELFGSILQTAKESHPPMSEQISTNVLDRYIQYGLGKRFNLCAEPAKVSDKTHNFMQRMLGYGGKNRSLKQEELQSTLHKIIIEQLRDARQYSEVIVDNVILQTTKVIEGGGLSNADQEAMHNWVKTVITEKMEAIQRHWDNGHNVVEKLRLKTKPRLYRFFQARVEGLEAATMLIKELQSIFEDELGEVHSHLVVKKVAAQLGHADWVMNWRVMRDCLDLQLLSLAERKSKKNTDMLLRYVSDGSTHFQELMNSFIRHAISTEVLEQEWEYLMQRLETCLKEQVSGNVSIGSFLVELSKKLCTHVDSKLASTLVSSISYDYYDEEILESDFYLQKVPEICRGLRKNAHPDLEAVKEEVIEGVGERMVQCEDESCRPRCDVRCPLCGITCFHSAGHTGRHDAIHQPAGLSGVRYVHSRELDAKTCLDSLNAGNHSFRYKHKGNYVPYCDFEKVYPSWVNPSKNERIATEVREYIFFNYQPELVKFYSGKEERVKPCPANAMPSNYNHDVNRLRVGLYNRLRPMFRDMDEAMELQLVSI